MALSPTFITLPAFTLAGLQQRVASSEGQVYALWQRFLPMIVQLAPITTVAYTSYGAMRHFDTSTKQFDYLAGVPVNNAIDLPAEFVVWHIPSHDYAVFACTLSTIAPTLRHIHNQWLPSSGFDQPNSPSFEYYGQDFMGQPDSPVSISVPIVSAHTEVHGA